MIFVYLPICVLCVCDPFIALSLSRGYKTKRKVETSVTENELKSAINKTTAGPSDDLDEKFKESSTSQGLGFG